jgi:hypothetical protein
MVDHEFWNRRLIGVGATQMLAPGQCARSPTFAPTASRAAPSQPRHRDRAIPTAQPDRAPPAVPALAAPHLPRNSGASENPRRVGSSSADARTATTRCPRTGHSARCHSARCHGARCHSARCHSARCHSAATPNRKTAHPSPRSRSMASRRPASPSTAVSGSSHLITHDAQQRRRFGYGRRVVLEPGAQAIWRTGGECSGSADILGLSV